MTEKEFIKNMIISFFSFCRFKKKTKSDIRNLLDEFSEVEATRLFERIKEIKVNEPEPNR